MLSKKNIRDLKLYCCEDYTKIEGYDRAIADKSNTRYDCHHRYETHFEDGSPRPKPLKAELLEELGYYKHRPAYELIILTVREHRQLHKKAEGCNTYATEEEYEQAHLEQRMQYQKDHPEEHRTACKKYYQKHPEESRRKTKVYGWVKRNPGSTDFPKKWSQEDIDYFYKLYK